MNVPQDHIHTWTVNKSSLLIRFYVWLYRASLDDVNFCKLFWAVVASPVVVPAVLFAKTAKAVGCGFGRAMFVAFHPACHRIAEWWRSSNTPEEQAKYEEESAARKAAHEARKAAKKLNPSLAMRFISALGKGADAVVAFLQEHTGIWRAIAYIAKAVWKVVAFVAVPAGYVLLVVIPAGALSALGYVIDQHTGGTLTVLQIAGICLASAGALFLLGWLAIAKSSIARAIAHGFAFVGRKLLGALELTADFLADGYHAVKYRTCPRVNVIESSPAQSMKIAA